MNNSKEFKKLIKSQSAKLMKRKEELTAETIRLNKVLSSIEDRILVWSSIDMLVVKDLEITKREVESQFLDVLNESNNLWLKSLAS